MIQNKTNSPMERQEIKDLITSDDKEMVAEALGCSERFIEQLLNDDRKAKRPKGKKVYETLERLAVVNKELNLLKKQAIAA